jgi:hypothetical protein
MLRDSTSINPLQVPSNEITLLEIFLAAQITTMTVDLEQLGVEDHSAEKSQVLVKPFLGAAIRISHIVRLPYDCCTRT